MKFLKLFFIFFILAKVSFSEDQIFMSLKFDDVNFRSGPSMDFPILFKYKLKFCPVKVVGEYDNWFKVIDKDDDSGWVSKHLLSKFKSFITIKDMQLLYSSSNGSYPIMRVEKNVVGKLIKCKNNRCKVKINDFKGWINKSDIWGI